MHGRAKRVDIAIKHGFGTDFIHAFDTCRAHPILFLFRCTRFSWHLTIDYQMVFWTRSHDFILRLSGIIAQAHITGYQIKITNYRIWIPGDGTVLSAGRHLCEQLSYPALRLSANKGWSSGVKNVWIRVVHPFNRTRPSSNYPLESYKM